MRSYEIVHIVVQYFLLRFCVIFILFFFSETHLVRRQVLDLRVHVFGQYLDPDLRDEQIF